MMIFDGHADLLYDVTKWRQAGEDRVFERRHLPRLQAGQIGGLGLSICRTIIEILGGDISVVSAPGKGTCFKIVHPVHRTETAAETAGAYR